MLAHELYLKNRKFGGEFVKSPKPVKKVIMRGKRPVLDGVRLDEYGEPLSECRLFQELLSMPSNTSSRLGLKFRTTSPNSPKPYVELYGLFQRTASSQTISLTIGKGTKSFKGIMNLQTEKEEFAAKGSIPLNIDDKRYFIANENLYNGYVRAGVITKNSTFNSSLFKDVCSLFFKHVRSRWKDEIQNKKISFSLIVLPAAGDVEYRSSDESEENVKSFIDSFGNKAKNYADGATQTAKFLSYDDPAFAINCTSGEEFYYNLGIGDESHRLININAEGVFNISGLMWMFTSINKPEYRFDKTHRGIYYQLWDNYVKLGKMAGRLESKSGLKVLCLKAVQAKMEVMLDENLTHGQMEELFSQKKESEIVPHALEVLIETKGKTTVWSDYLAAVRSLLTQKNMDKEYLLSRFTLRLREKLSEWLEERSGNSALEFFQKCNFCIKVLYKSEKGVAGTVNDNEQYAYSVGTIAAEYISFKERAKESNNSLRDIIAYSKYDREKLRFVMQRMSLGLSLSKTHADDIKMMETFMRENHPAAEIADDAAYDDYSYFFYKGYFSKNKKGGNKD